MEVLMAASNTQWLSKPYGAPTATSEITAVADFYRPETLTAFGRAKCPEESGVREGEPQSADEARAALEKAVRAALATRLTL
jgi:hypothetical protein